MKWGAMLGNAMCLAGCWRSDVGSDVQYQLLLQATNAACASTAAKH